MFGFFADSLFLQKMRSGFVLGLHLTIDSILEFLRLIFEELLIFLQLIIEYHVFFKLVFVIAKERMFNDI